MKGRRTWKKMSPAKMATWRAWLWFKETFFVPTKCVLLKLTSASRRKAKGKAVENSNFIAISLSLSLVLNLYFTRWNLQGMDMGWWVSTKTWNPAGNMPIYGWCGRYSILALRVPQRDQKGGVEDLHIGDPVFSQLEIMSLFPQSCLSACPRFRYYTDCHNQ